MEWIGVGDAARRVVVVPVHARFIAAGRRRPRPVVDRSVAARAVEHERQQVDALGHSVAVRHTADEVQATLTVEWRQGHAPTPPHVHDSHAYCRTWENKSPPQVKFITTAK